ncbi:copper chaperone CopZ [Paraburkholderia sp. MM5482-R2]
MAIQLALADRFARSNLTFVVATASIVVTVMRRVEVETVNSSLPLKLRIGGTDCASCALKIENAMKRLPVVSDINVSYGQESLTLTFDEDRTSLAAIEAKSHALGFTPVGGPVSEPTGASEAGRSSWWRAKARARVHTCPTP